MVFLTPLAYSHTDIQLQIETLTRQLEGQPDKVEWLLKRGDLQRRHQNWDLARADFNRVREIQPDNATVDWFEGRLEVESGQPESGVRLLDRFLKTNPAHVIALQNRAQAHLLLGQPLLAAQDFGTVIRVADRPSPTLYNSHALALVLAGADHITDAMNVVQAGLDKFPADVTLAGIGTDISLALADTEMAARLIQGVSDPVLKLQQWQARIALLDCETGFQDRAAAWFTGARDSSPEPGYAAPLLTKPQLFILADKPTVANCRQAALENLQRQ